MRIPDFTAFPAIWRTYIEIYKLLNIKGRGFSKIGIFPRNTIGELMLFTATPNTSYKNARKKQNTRRYTLKIKVSDVCWIGGGGESRTHVLLSCQKTFYILSLSIISYFYNAGKHAL